MSSHQPIEIQKPLSTIDDILSEEINTLMLKDIFLETLKTDEQSSFPIISFPNQMDTEIILAYLCFCINNVNDTEENRSIPVCQIDIAETAKRFPSDNIADNVLKAFSFGFTFPMDRELSTRDKIILVQELSVALNLNTVCIFGLELFANQYQCSTAELLAEITRTIAKTGLNIIFITHDDWLKQNSSSEHFNAKGFNLFRHPQSDLMKIRDTLYSSISIN
jgi:hypothetical protein